MLRSAPVPGRSNVQPASRLKISEIPAHASRFSDAFRSSFVAASGDGRAPVVVSRCTRTDPALDAGPFPLPEGEGKGEGERVLGSAGSGSLAIGSRSPKNESASAAIISKEC